MKKTLSLFLSFIILISYPVCGVAAKDDINSVISDTAKYIYNTTSNPQIASIGGEWAVIGLSRSDEDIPSEYFEKYYENALKYVKEKNGILHNVKYTEYSRVILSLTSIGKNPKDVAGYNLLTPLVDYEKTVWQGVNGAIFALIALDSNNYEIPQNSDITVQATREMYVNYILKKQNTDGGWALSGNISDIDVTAMALQALAKYKSNVNVNTAIEKALKYMSENQNADGGFSSRNAETAESCAQVIVALCELGISVEDARFIKNDNTVADKLLTYYVSKKGFKHTLEDGVPNQMATEQALYALVALQRANDKKNTLYDMSDVATVSDNAENQTTGLLGKNPDVKKMNIATNGKTFEDIAGHINRSAIEALAARNIINGKTENTFNPDNTMTRAEFATIIVRGLGLPIKSNAKFCDVTKNDWFYDYVNTAYLYGIVNGVSDTEFNPNGTITREEAVVMTAKSAKLCGMDTEIESIYARDILSGFIDYVKISDWAVLPVAFCYDSKILSDDAIEIKPKENVTRGEIAQMLYNMLSLSKLI